MRDLEEAGFRRGTQLCLLWRRRRLHQALHPAVRAIEGGEKLAPGDTERGIALAQRLALAVPSPGLRRRRHMLDELEHVVEPGDALRIATGEGAVLAEDRTTLRPEPGGPVAVEGVVTRAELAGGTEY